eukprot:g7377.t1
MTWTSPELTPWPRPRNCTNGTEITVTSSVHISTGSASSLLQRAVARFAGGIPGWAPPSPVAATSGQVGGIAAVSLLVTVISDDERLWSGVDESYALDVHANGSAVARAPTVYGALHALEAFAQLFEAVPGGGDSGADLLRLRGLPWAIADAPRFAHRGMLVDSSRHFLPLAAIRAHIDAMAMNALNVLHWHLVDFQSFPVQSEALPQLSQGAWSPAQRYTLDELRGVVAYARDRGVRVVAEVDTPGHSASWGRGHPEVVTQCPETVKNGGGGQVALDPSTNKTYEVVAALLQELGGVFTDDLFHLGGDEVRYACWNESAPVRAHMRARGFAPPYDAAAFAQLEAEYEGRLLDVAARALGANRTVVVYQEVLDQGIALPARVVFGVWKRGNGGGAAPAMPINLELQKVVRAGHRAVLANGNGGEWYLNDGFGNGPDRASWDVVYALDPLNGTSLTAAEQARVLGGEASLWGEEIDEGVLQQRAWPRGAAFAERMWTAAGLAPRARTAIAAEVGPRLARQHCKLRQRGILSSPPSPGSCLATAPAPDSAPEEL